MPAILVLLAALLQSPTPTPSLSPAPAGPVSSGPEILSYRHMMIPGAGGQDRVIAMGDISGDRRPDFARYSAAEGEVGFRNGVTGDWLWGSAFVMDAILPELTDMAAIGNLSGDGLETAAFLTPQRVALYGSRLRGGVPADPDQDPLVRTVTLCRLGAVNGSGRDSFLYSTTVLGTGAASIYVASWTPGSPTLDRIRVDAGPVSIAHRLAGLGDVDRDGRPDFAVGEAHWVSVYSGATLARIGRIVINKFPVVVGGPSGPEGGGVCGLGDVNRDGHADILVLVKTGPSLAYSGRDLAAGIQRSLYSVPISGSAIAGKGDFDRDGVPDILAPSGSDGSWSLFSGRNGAFLRRWRPPGLEGSLFRGTGWDHAAAADVLGDVNGDGAPEVLLLGQAPLSDGMPFGHVWTLSGRLPTRFVRGDVNFSGGVDISDAIAVINHLNGIGPAPTIGDAADADDNGRLDVDDALRILEFLHGSGWAPAAPYPAAGVDETIDLLR